VTLPRSAPQQIDKSFFKKEALACRSARKESKRFFFEKKKQKTFMSFT
jgi:hypothetical protein